MRTEPIDISHKSILADRLKSVPTAIAEYSFPNLFLFRHAHDYHVVFDEDIFIRGVTYDGGTYLMPTRPAPEIDLGYLRRMMGQCDFLFPIAEEWLHCFNDDDFFVTYKDGDSDYIYTVEKIATFAGKKLHGKRNLLHQFDASYSHEARPLTESHIHDAKAILREWQNESGQSEKETDFAPCMEALERYEELVLCGGIFYADGKPAGFIVGEELTDETFTLHFAKGITRFKGIYQYIFNTFATILPKKYRFLNFEQDMGKENLRLSKESYIPDMHLKKMRVSLNIG